MNRVELAKVIQLHERMVADNNFWDGLSGAEKKMAISNTEKAKRLLEFPISPYEAIEKVLAHAVLDPTKGDWILPRWWKNVLEQAGINTDNAGLGDAPDIWRE